MNSLASVTLVCVLLSSAGCGKSEPPAPSKPAPRPPTTEKAPPPKKPPAAAPAPSEPEPVPAEPAPAEPPPSEQPPAAKPDLATWTPRALKGFRKELPAVFFSGSQFVTVGDEGAVYTSDDGNRWYKHAIETGSPLAAVAVTRDGVIVVIGPDKYNASRAAGSETWRPGLSPVDASDVLALGDGFVAIGEGATWTSSDGQSWDKNDVPDLDLDAATIGRDGLAVTMSFNARAQETTIHTSSDGKAWTTKSLGPELAPRALAFGRDRYWVAATQGHVVLVSEDLETFASHKLPGRADALGIAASDAGVVVVGRGGFIAISEDGESFALVPPPTEESLTDVACSPSVCVAVGSGGRILTTATMTE